MDAPGTIPSEPGRFVRPNLFMRAVARPESYLAGTFLALIAAGAVLLVLPASHAAEPVGMLDAVFTSTSAVCVTGLTVVDTAGDYSRFGQVVILALIQAGGLGIMTFGALIVQITGHRISLRSQAALTDVFYQQNAAAVFRRNLKWIVVMTFAIEAVGTLLLYAGLPAGSRGPRGAYDCAFHAVSAFCNAGFSTFEGNLTAVRDRPGFLAAICVLVVLGGLGFGVLLEAVSRSWRALFGRQRTIAWSLNSRVVAATSLVLIVLGAVFLALTGLGPGAAGVASTAGHALVQSISARTAGFNTVDLRQAPTAALLGLVLLMFVGGSPGSCAGGVKTTSLAIWVARLRARLRLQEDVIIGGRRVPVDIVRRTGLLIGVCTLFNLLGVFVLTLTEAGRPGVRLEDVLFEQISAFGTVGLSTGLTPTLSAAGKVWIILTMFVGRLGPLTIALIVSTPDPKLVRLPEERLMIG